MADWRLSAGVGWTGRWQAPRRAAGLGGLILDWLSWHPGGEVPAPNADVAALCALARAEEPAAPRWRGLAPQAHVVRVGVGLSCADAWPRARGRFAYAAARLRAARTWAAALRPGTYLGYRAWLDGAPVAVAPAALPSDVDANLHPLRLEPGVHALVLEVDREHWHTVFHVRLSDPGGGDLDPAAVAVAVAGDEPAPDPYDALLDASGALCLDGVDAGRWPRWREAFSDAYRGLLALPPARPRTAEVEARRAWRGCTLERVVLRGGPAGPVPLWCLLPPAAGRDGLPAVLALHGHGAGKDDVVGLTAEDPAHASRVASHDYAYALEFARRGYAVFAPDLLGFGERAHAAPPPGARDPCDNDCFKALMAGALPLALHLRDLEGAVEYARNRPEVDPARLGCVGLSLGGRLTMYLAALDGRLRVAVVSGALNLLRERLASYAACGAQLLPGLWCYGDTPEVFALIAPRPLLLQLGAQDATSPEVFAAAAFARVRRAYGLAGADGALALDLHAGGHRFHSAAAVAFVDHWLRGG